jgi:ATP-dependent protease Clp ATPase subunit
MPDTVVALGLDGRIKFVSVQLQKMLKHDREELVGVEIEEILYPKSKGAIQRLVKDLVAAEHIAAVGVNESSSSEDNSGNFYSGSSSNENVARSMPFPLLVKCENDGDDAKV